MRNPVTTISGGILIILSALTLFGIITQDQSIEIGQYVTVIIEAIVGFIGVFKASDSEGGV
ncbi:MAG: hypothetical protein IID16_00750 [Candidatus Marinimicrobia bacterium]|nr:hypothetical protein [Candidatus Neomarinimicrobiota bacterium]